jgi:hypothetical protein
MPQGRSGINADTPRKLVFDAGEVFVGIDLDDLELPYPADPENPQAGESLDPVGDALEGATSLGATRGGATFNPGRAIREMEADGAMGPVKRMRRREEIMPTLQATLLEATRANILRAFAGSTESAVTSGFQKIQGGAIGDTNYSENIALLSTYSGATYPVVFVLKDAMATEVADLGLEDQNEPVLETTFTGHFDPDDILIEPWIIYHPGEENPNLISTSSAPSATDVDPSIDVLVEKDEFADASLVASLNNWIYDADTTSLEIDSITRTSEIEATVAFTGTATAGTLTLQAKSAALTGHLATQVLSVEIT